jgi:hypothetical protein
VRNLLHSSRIFWSFAAVATAVVLVLSVALGKVVGAHLLSRGVGLSKTPPAATAHYVPIVLGGQMHAVAALGQSSPIWPKARPAPPDVTASKP